MIKGRLFVVDQDTLKETIRDKVVSIRTPALTNPQWLKTVADIMADLLQIEIGDYVFLWERVSQDNRSRIHGVYRAISEPYYESSGKDDSFPFKMKIEKAYDFQEPIDEYDVLNCPFAKISPWTIIGKKVADKSRGTSPLSNAEMQLLITLLLGKNKDYVFHPFTRKKTVKNPLHIDYTITGSEPSQGPALNALNPNKLAFLNPNHQLKYEKVLETIFNQEMTARNAAFYQQIGVDVNKVIWYSNYLPYSIERSEMDYLIIESDDGFVPSRISLIEFMISTIDTSHISRSMMYSKWVNETIASGQNITQPILICPTLYKTERKNEEIFAFIKECENKFSTKPLQVYTYSFAGGNPTFKKEY